VYQYRTKGHVLTGLVVREAASSIFHHWVVRIQEEALWQILNIILIICTCQLTHEIVLNAGITINTGTFQSEPTTWTNHVAVFAFTMLTTADKCRRQLQSEFMYRYVCVNQSELVQEDKYIFKNDPD
jgi:hypothetical protein